MQSPEQTAGGRVCSATREEEAACYLLGWFYALQMCVWSCIQELIYHTVGRVAAFVP